MKPFMATFLLIKNLKEVLQLKYFPYGYGNFECVHMKRAMVICWQAPERHWQPVVPSYIEKKLFYSDNIWKYP